jgi:hypothetical protein
MHQPLSEIEPLPLRKLYALAELAAAMKGKTFR